MILAVCLYILSLSFLHCKMGLVIASSEGCWEELIKRCTQSTLHITWHTDIVPKIVAVVSFWALSGFLQVHMGRGSGWGRAFLESSLHSRCDPWYCVQRLWGCGYFGDTSSWLLDRVPGPSSPHFGDWAQKSESQKALKGPWESHLGQEHLEDVFPRV